MRKLLSVFFIGMFMMGSAFAATKETTKETTKLNSIYMPAGNSIAGNPQGSITLVEFFDYNCGYCRMMYPNLLELIKSDSNLRVVFREYPVLSPKSVLPAQAALAAQKQGKYSELHDAMMEAKQPLTQSEIVKLAKRVGIDTDQLLKDMDSPAIKNQVQTNLTTGQAMNIQGVPTFIVVKTNPPSKAQPQIMVGPSIGQLNTMIKKAQDA